MFCSTAQVSNGTSIQHEHRSYLHYFTVLLIFCNLGESILLTKAIDTVLEDDGFKIPSAEASSALCMAEDLSQWVKQPQNNVIFTTFSKYLVKKLQSCLGSSTLTQRTRTARMWGLFQEFRTSEQFMKEWKSFLKLSIKSTAIPAFYQYVTYEVFKALIKNEFKCSAAQDYSVCPLTADDQNALRYVAGYVCRKVREKLESSTNIEKSQKNDMIITLLEFRGSGIHSEHESADWINSIDRGGLWHVTDDVFTFFCCVEEVIRHFFRQSNTKGNDVTEVVRGIENNEDVLFQWCILSIELDEKVAELLRDMIIKLYVTIRGHAFANSCMELYKQSKKKTVQKKKGIRSRVLNKENHI